MYSNSKQDVKNNFNKQVSFGNIKVSGLDVEASMLSDIKPALEILGISIEDAVGKFVNFPTSDGTTCLVCTTDLMDEGEYLAIMNALELPPNTPVEEGLSHEEAKTKVAALLKIEEFCATNLRKRMMEISAWAQATGTWVTTM